MRWKVRPEMPAKVVRKWLPNRIWWRSPPQVTCPDDFDQFWDGVLSGLNGIPLDSKVTHDPLRSTETASVYQVCYRSLDDLEIFGWYAVPTSGDGPFPGCPDPARLQV